MSLFRVLSPVCPASRLDGWAGQGSTMSSKVLTKVRTTTGRALLSMLMLVFLINIGYCASFKYISKNVYSVQWVNYDKKVSFRDIVKKNTKADYIISGTFFDIKTGLVAFAPYTRDLEGFYGVTLVENGVICYHPTQQGYKTLNTTSCVPRLGVGIKDGKWVIFEDRCPLYWLAMEMWSFGCRDAVGLDGGSSVGIYSKKDGFLIYPKRSITNAYTFCRK